MEDIQQSTRTRARRCNMKRLLCAMLAILPLCVTAFCAFGFLASFEEGPISVWHFLYLAGGIGSFAIAMRLVSLGMLAQTLAGLALLAGTLFCIGGLVESSRLSASSWEIGYGVLGCVCLFGTVPLLRGRKGNSRPSGCSGRTP